MIYLGDVTMSEGKALAEMFPDRVSLVFQFDSEKLKAYFVEPPKSRKPRAKK